MAIFVISALEKVGNLKKIDIHQGEASLRKDGSFGFDFWGIYEKITTNELIAYTLGDGRKVMVTTQNKNETDIEIMFEAESTHAIEIQRSGWQAILDNFKNYVEEKTP